MTRLYPRHAFQLNYRHQTLVSLPHPIRKTTLRRREFRIVYTVAEAAELLGIGRSTAYELAASGELPTVKIGGRTVVTRPTLAALAGVEPPLPRDLDRAGNEQTANPATLPQSAVRRSSRASDQSALPFSI